MVKFGDEKIRNESVHCVSAILEIIPVENLKNLLPLLAESDVTLMKKNIELINKRISSLN
jgi:hypothetical protein